MGIIADSIRREDWESITERVEGWGINDVKYIVQPVSGGVKSICPFYQDWQDMLHRAFNKNFHKNNPTYIGTKVCAEWKNFSNFVEWVTLQPCEDWKNMCLDKDFLSEGCKIYSPETCVYIPNNLNCFLNIKPNKRGNFLLGVTLSDKKNKPFKAQCRNPFTGKNRYLGNYNCELSAHLAYKSYKNELALKYIELGLDSRVVEVLLKRFSPDSDLTQL